MAEATFDSIATALVFAAAIVLIHVVIRRSIPATDGHHEPFASRTTHESPGGSREFTPLADTSAWQWKIVSGLSEAEELLDRAEAEGYADREVIVVGPASFLVRWRGRA